MGLVGVPMGPNSFLVPRPSFPPFFLDRALSLTTLLLFLFPSMLSLSSLSLSLTHFFLSRNIPPLATHTTFEPTIPTTSTPSPKPSFSLPYPCEALGYLQHTQVQQAVAFEPKSCHFRPLFTLSRYKFSSSLSYLPFCS